MQLFALTASAVILASSAIGAPVCSFLIEGNDQMQYTSNGKKLETIEIDGQCKDFTINLKHIGKVPKAAMGHNVVVAKTADKMVLVTNAGKAGPAKDYQPTGDKVIAASKLIGPGESTSISFPVSKLAGADYEAFCTFPGHFAAMSAKLVVKPSKK